jgi:CheY-like chemotaxis protein
VHKDLEILVVEDEPLLRDSYRIILQKALAPKNVDTASNGLEALDLCEKQNYHVILLDIMMPALDGLGFLEKFPQTNQRSKTKTKIIVLSNLTFGDKIERALKLGADSYLEKSQMQPSELVSFIQSALLLSPAY